MAQFSFIDLFAGIGGFRLALESLGGRCLGFSEIYRDAINTYCLNYGDTERDNFGDITRIRELPKHDLMTAGVPCQSWSIAGKNLGFDDDRGQLWNDTLYLLNKTHPKAFIFENVKGLADPRNREALNYILGRIAQAGYHAKPYVLNACDYGVPQTRVRIYIVGFRNKRHAEHFRLPQPSVVRSRLSDVLDDMPTFAAASMEKKPRWSLSCNESGMNDYFLFNDLRNGDTTIHSWDILPTTERQKQICYLLLHNRRKRDYGKLDGNPLSARQFKSLDPTITSSELERLVELGILKRLKYLFKMVSSDNLTETQQFVASQAESGLLNIDELKTNRALKLRRIKAAETLGEMEAAGIAECVEERYDFKNTKISTGLFGVNRIFLPSSSIYPTLVASDTNDFVTPVNIQASSVKEFRRRFLAEVYQKGDYRRITKTEACRIQGFPPSFLLPEARPRWMHLIGNSVCVPVIRQLAQAVIATGVFAETSEGESLTKRRQRATEKVPSYA